MRNAVSLSNLPPNSSLSAGYKVNVLEANNKKENNTQNTV